jgi:colanic acid biosynthesis glycosyl transferase WcaI
MLASGRAVLATALPGTGVAEAVRNCGIATAPGDSAAFAAALRQLASDHALRHGLGRAAREQAEATLAREGILLRFEQRLAHLLGAGAERAGAGQGQPVPKPDDISI